MIVAMNAKGGNVAFIADFLFAAGAGLMCIAVNLVILLRIAGALSSIKNGVRDIYQISEKELWSDKRRRQHENKAHS